MKCNTKYFSKECPKCNNKNHKIYHTRNNNTYKNNNKNTIENIKKINIKKNIIPIIIATAISIIAIIMIKNEYVEYQQNKQIAKMIYGTDDYEEIDKINKKFMKSSEKTMKEIRKLYLPKE